MAVPRIVAAGTEDVEELVRLNARLFLEDAGPRDPHTDTSWPAKHGREHFVGLLSRDDAVCLLALRGGAKVGYLGGYVKEATPLRPVRVAELQSMYVEGSERGRGVGARLIEEFFTWARGREAGRVSVTAYAANVRAVGFYWHLGFMHRSVSLEREL